MEAVLKQAACDRSRCFVEFTEPSFRSGASHPDTRQWLDDIYFGEFYGGIRARSAGQAIRRLEKAWDDDAILLSLDFSLCFDYVRPELAVKALELHGAPAELLVVLK